MKKFIVFLGLPGSGKGTQSEILTTNYSGNAIHFSVGNELRKNVQQKTPLGISIKQILEKGQLVDNNTINQIVFKFFNDLNENISVIIFDGYPRTIEQAIFLDNLAKNLMVDIINIEISSEDAFDRLTNRLTCSVCSNTYSKKNLDTKDKCPRCEGKLVQRNDDNDQAIKNRLNIAQEENKSLVSFYSQRKNFFSIDGSDDPNTVSSKIRNLINVTRHQR